MERFYKGDYAERLLDSKLITPVFREKYTLKVVKCGEYIQLYYYDNSRYRKTKERFDLDDLRKKRVGQPTYHTIEDRNIIRSKLQCQRIAKANAKEWKSFITLTYADNMQDIKKGKKDLSNFLDKIKKVKKDFKYIAIPEFQKRGAVHFHLLTNLSLQDNDIIFQQKDNNNYYDVKYWCKGFTSVEFLEGDIKKIVGYISKYMTEDCDHRLFMIRRYTTSQNLTKPQIDFLNIDNFRYTKDKRFLNKLLKDKELIYENEYSDKFDNNVTFLEFLSVNIMKDYME